MHSIACTKILITNLKDSGVKRESLCEDDMLKLFGMVWLEGKSRAPWLREDGGNWF